MPGRAIRPERRALNGEQGQAMAVQIIPVQKLSPEALRGIVAEFISRAGIDDGADESSRERNFRQVSQKLATGAALLLFDDETQTTNILLADDPLLKRLLPFPEA